MPQACFNGHDHNLQHLHKRSVGYHQICSGAGSRVGPEFRGHKHSPFQYGGNGEPRASSAGVAAAVLALLGAVASADQRSSIAAPPRSIACPLIRLLQHLTNLLHCAACCRFCGSADGPRQHGCGIPGTRQPCPTLLHWHPPSHRALAFGACCLALTSLLCAPWWRLLPGPSDTFFARASNPKANQPFSLNHRIALHCAS